MKNIKTNDLFKQYIQDNDCLIIDVRTPLEYAQGHIPKSFNIPLEKLIDKYILYLNKDFTYYIICKDGTRSKLACNTLNKHKYNAYNVKDGLAVWEGPIEKDRLFN